MTDFSAFEKKIGLDFHNKELLERVFIHRSYLNEVKNRYLEHNERLEFLGDAVLELVVTEHLYKTYPNPEGELTNWRSATVRGENLAKAARELGIGELLLMSHGEAKSGGRERGLLLANAFEALIGAMYLDLGYDTTAKFIHDKLIALLPDIIEKGLHIDSKSHLQEICQERLGITPNYRVLSEEGPDHSKQFVVGVFADGRQIASGSGPSKQRAEQAAAAEGLNIWDEFVRNFR